MKSLRIVHLAFAAVLGFLLVASPAAAAPTVFPVDFLFTNPCNGEIVLVSGEASGSYNAQGSKHVVTFRVAAESDGQEYQLNLHSNGVFAEPSGSAPGVIFFDIPHHGIVVGTGQTPNFKVEGTNRIFVSTLSGEITGAFTQGPDITTCLG